LTALRERMRALFGDEQKLLPVDFIAEVPTAESSEAGDTDATSEESDLASAPTPAVPARFRLWGFIGQPGVSRSTREDQHLFVNRRPVENRGLNFALLEGYHTALMKGRYPVCCLFLEVDPATVDVNIHPSKREVKFHNERMVRQWTAQAIRETLLRFHGGAADQARPGSASSIQSPSAPCQPREPVEGPATPLVGGSERRPAATMAAPAPAARFASTDSWSEASAVTRDLPSFDSLTGSGLAGGRKAAPSGSGPVPAESTTPAGAGARLAPLEAASLATHTPPLDPQSLNAARSAGEPTPLLNVPLRLVGVIGRLYVVLESDRGLVLMDQHAAHERILFEQMLERVERGDVPSQRLLLPETVELSVRDAEFLREQLSVLTRLGVGLSEFGERTFLLDGLPPMVRVSEPRRFVLELVDQLKAAGQQVNAQRLGEQTIAKTVCRHAVKANDPLSGPELENLVKDLRHCAMPYTCPHGRPTLIEMSYRELEKKFGRLA